MKTKIEEVKVYEKRMYFFVIYQLTGIQKGIQCGHAVEQYASNYKNDPDYMDFVENWRTWIILDGGTTNSNPNQVGTLNDILLDLRVNKLKHAYFHEPDLNNALTAVCFLCDERVFNKKDYPDLADFIIKGINDPDYIGEGEEPLTSTDANELRKFGDTWLAGCFPDQYNQWLELIGGKENEYFRNLISGKRLASN